MSTDTWTLDEAIERLTRPFVEAPSAPSITLGHVTLTEQQCVTVSRARAVLQRWGGVLLGDATGAGKTYVALALASEYTRRLVVAPAALRSTWEQALARAGLRAVFISYEALSRGTQSTPDADVVVLDEAHHLRTTTTRRYRAARTLCAGRRVVLVTATPVHNRTGDLDALFALFLGVDVADLKPAAKSSLMVRTARSVHCGPPVFSHPPLRMPDVPRVVEGIVELPPPVPPRDGGTALALWRMSLLRAWSSSAAALQAMLRRAQLQLAALTDAWRAGRTPTRRELHAEGDDVHTQLAWTELWVSKGAVSAQQLADAERCAAALAELRRLVAAHGAADAARADALRRIRAQHTGVPVLACTQYAGTAESLGSLLRNEPEVAVLTARGGRIASGPLSRDAVLAHFAPLAQGAAPPPARARISLLIATDLVSEGLNLQDAGVVVHLDTPWTPARLTQRVGRLTRPGSPHELVDEYRFSAPVAANALLKMERRLATKRRAATLVEDSANAERNVHDALRQLRARTGDVVPRVNDGASVVASSNRNACIALVADPAPRLVAAMGAAPLSTDPMTVGAVLQLLLHAQPSTTEHDTRPAERRITHWLRREHARRAAMADRPSAAKHHRPAIAASRRALLAAPSHARAALAAAGSAALATQRSLPDRTVVRSSKPHILAIIVIKSSRSPFPALRDD